MSSEMWRRAFRSTEVNVSEERAALVFRPTNDTASLEDDFQ